MREVIPIPEVVAFLGHRDNRAAALGKAAKILYGLHASLGVHPDDANAIKERLEDEATSTTSRSPEQTSATVIVAAYVECLYRESISNGNVTTVPRGRTLRDSLNQCA